MRILPVCLLLLALPLWLAAQTEKSATPIPTQNSNPNTQNSTRAVVVGISDYQDEDIPDLRFAHRDAGAAFINAITLDSTNARIWNNLGWVVQPNPPLHRGGTGV